MKFQFGNVVVVDGDQIGLIVKSWDNLTYDVYIRNHNGIKEYKEMDIKHYIYSKSLSEEERGFH